MSYVDLNTTPSLKKGEIKERWLLIDAEGIVLGKMSSVVASLLRGKYSPQYTAHMNMNIKIIIVNSDKFVFTKNKWENKVYVTHTGQPGGMKKIYAKDLRVKRGSDYIVRLAITRMMTSNTLRRYLLRNLFIYEGKEHPHSAQKPENFFISKEY